MLGRKLGAQMDAIGAHLARSEIHGFLDKKNLWLMIAGFTFFNLFVRSYQAVYGWSVGLDAFAPEFKTYWMTWLYIETALYIPLFAFIGAYLWKTRVRDMDALTSTEVLTNHFHHLVWLLAYGIAIYWGASFYTEQDGTWHQTVIRDTDFTPSHIIQFYTSYPIYILTGWGAFMYARTRLPAFSKGVSLPYLIVVVGPFMILPNVGLHEWGHTFWWMEELFVAPLHYGFVFFGWMALGLCGLLLQIFEDIGNHVGPTLKQEDRYDGSYHIVSARARARAGGGTDHIDAYRRPLLDKSQGISTVKVELSSSQDREQESVGEGSSKRIPRDVRLPGGRVVERSLGRGEKDMSKHPKPLTIDSIDFDNEDDMDALDNQVLEAGLKILHANIREAVQLGIIDEKGNLLKTKLPPDMREGAETDFGG